MRFIAILLFEILPVGRLTPARPANPERPPRDEDIESSWDVGARRVEEV